MQESLNSTGPISIRLEKVLQSKIQSCRKHWEGRRKNCHGEWRGYWSVLTEWPWAADLYQRQILSLFILYLFTYHAFIEHLLFQTVCEASCLHPHRTCSVERKVSDGCLMTTMNVYLQLGCMMGSRGHPSHRELWPNNHCSLGGLHEEVTTGLRLRDRKGLPGWRWWEEPPSSNQHGWICYGWRDRGA